MVPGVGRLLSLANTGVDAAPRRDVDANDQFGGGAKKVRVDDKDRDATGDDLADLRVGEVEAKAGRATPHDG